ncbi:MAG: uracil phosphoribosyltransferase [Synechococcaceae bacterium WB8_1B_136]|nr:uracil phosphoribosyltransferase [Synechococcaceae bacterium WB8_1B_136]
MSKTLRVVVPPHPLIGHWLTLLRDHQTPNALFATAMAELGRWLTYEALRDWIPYQRVQVQTPLALTEGTVVDGTVPLLAVAVLRAGLGLWEGGRTVLPSAAVAHMAFERGSPGGALHCCLNGLPGQIPANAGVLVFAPVLASGATVIQVLEQLEALGVGGARVRVVTALAAAPGLKTLGERYGDLTLHTGCIDAELDGQQRIVPGLGDVAERLYGLVSAGSVG